MPAGQVLTLADGTETFVRMAGDATAGPPTLLLHGLGATAALNWWPCFDALAEQGLVVAPDHRGHGRGIRTGRRFTLEACADDAAAMLTALGSGPAVVVGYSMGGPIAQLMARRHPQLVAGIVLCATARDFRGAPADRLRFTGLAVAAAASRFAPPIRGPRVPMLPDRFSVAGWALSEVRGHEPAAIVAAGAALGRFTSRDWVRTLQVPTAVLIHTKDRLVPPRRQQKLAEALPGTYAVELPIDHLGATRAPELFLDGLLAAHASVVERSTAADLAG